MVLRTIESATFRFAVKTPKSDANISPVRATGPKAAKRAKGGVSEFLAQNASTSPQRLARSGFGIESARANPSVCARRSVRVQVPSLHIGRLKRSNLWFLFRGAWLRSSYGVL
jgi:hypothetical protein